MRYIAKPVSAKPGAVWYVADTERAGLNVTVELQPSMRGLLPIVPQAVAESIAMGANEGRADRQ